MDIVSVNFPAADGRYLLGRVESLCTVRLKIQVDFADGGKEVVWYWHM